MNHSALQKTILECMTSLTLKEIAALTGIQLTRCHRIRNGKEMTLEEAFKLANAFGIQIATGEEVKEIYRIKEQVTGEIDQLRSQVSSYSDEHMEIKIAQKYGITVELLRWTLSNPALKAKQA